MKPVDKLDVIRKHITEWNMPYFPQNVFPEFLFRIRQVKVDNRIITRDTWCLQIRQGQTQTAVQVIPHWRRFETEPYRAFVDVDGELCISQMMEITE